MQNFKIERLSENNLDKLIYLYKQCFNLKVSIEFLKRKYATQAFGAQYIGYLALDEKSLEPAGYYGVFPVLGHYNGLNYLIAQSGDTMTNPNYQGRGLFTYLANETYKLAKAEGIHFVFGFPNSNSYPGFIKKLNWKHYTDINNYVIKTGVLPFDKLAKKIPLFNLCYQKFVSYQLRRVVTQRSFPNSLGNEASLCGYIEHDETFFNYKVYTDFFKIKLKNKWCIIKVDGRLWVGDIEQSNKEELLAIIGELKFLAKKIGCATVQLSLSSNSNYDIVLKDKFQVKSTNPVGFINISGVLRPEEFKYVAIDFDTY